MYDRIERPLRWLLNLVIVGGLATVVAEHGFRLTPSVAAGNRTAQAAVLWSFLGLSLIRLALMPQRWHYIRHHKVQIALLALLLLDLLAFNPLVAQTFLSDVFQLIHIKKIAVLYVVFIQGAIVLIALVQGAYYSQALATWQIRPAQTLVLSFAGLILLGSLLLMLPRATVAPGSMSWLTALFTATSAVCVTGLIVVDTATYFTPFGQMILLLLFQVGGLGIITFATVISMMIRGGLDTRQKVFLQDFVSSQHFSEISATVRRIVGCTLGIEVLGSLSLYHAWRQMLPEPDTRLWHAIFHAVSAFCNAGFSTLSANLAGPESAMVSGVNATVMMLIVLGGLGFTVLWEGWLWGRDALRGRWRRLSVHLRLVMLSTGFLIVVGALEERRPVSSWRRSAGTRVLTKIGDFIRRMMTPTHHYTISISFGNAV